MLKCAGDSEKYLDEENSIGGEDETLGVRGQIEMVGWVSTCTWFLGKVEVWCGGWEL